MKPSTAGKFAPATFLDDDKSLIVRGHFVDTVQRSTTRYMPIFEDLEEELALLDPETKSMLWLRVQIQTFQEWFALTDSLGKSTAREDQLKRLYYTLNHSRTWIENKADGEQFKSLLQCFSPTTSPQLPSNMQNVSSESSSNIGVFSSKDERIRTDNNTQNIVNAIISKLDSNDEFSRLFLEILNQCDRTRLFVTSGGLLGKALRNIQDGDLVALKAGVLNDAIWRTMITDRECLPNRGYCRVRQSYMQQVQDVTARCSTREAREEASQRVYDAKETVDAHDYLTSVNTLAVGRRPFITRKGYIGLGPVSRTSFSVM